MGNFCSIEKDNKKWWPWPCILFSASIFLLIEKNVVVERAVRVVNNKEGEEDVVRRE